LRVFELTQAGRWLDGISDPAASHELQSLLHLLESCITDAAISLALFEATSHVPFPSHDPAKWERERAQESEIRARLESELPTDLPMDERWKARSRIDEAARVEAKRARWEAGEMPSSYSHRLPFIHAKTFLYALDSLQKSLAILAKKPDAPAAVGAALVEFQHAFPHLRDLRDSAHHVEDRVQGRRFGKPISLQPIDNSLINAAGGALVIDALINNRFGGTLGDGSYGEVEVSAQSAAVATAIVQAVLDSFSWSGHPSHSPH
jgi:hypothetical protein